jgi:hypothetical protein
LHDLQVRILLALSTGVGYRALDDDHVARQIDAYCQCGCTADDIDVAIEVALRDSGAIRG